VITIFSFLIVLGVLVFVHELGHFIAAKKVGVRVETFSIGMGPKLLRRKKGETEYCLSAIPLGGYVKLKGENPEEESTGAPDELMSKSIPARFSIFIAGPGMNVLLAIVLVSLVFLIGIQMPKYLDELPVIGWIDEESPAQESGLQPGDIIRSVGGKAVETWEQALLVISSSTKKPLDIEVERDGESKNMTILPDIEKQFGTEYGYIGVQPVMKPIVGGVQPGFPAEKAGVQIGDEIIAINDVHIIHWIQMADVIHAHPNEELQITFLRNGQEITKPITPQLEGKYGYLGISSQQQTVLRKYGIVESFSRGIQRCWELTWMTFDFLRRLVARQVSAKTLGGPIMIAQMSGEVAKEGLSEMLNFMGLVSLSLAIFNLLPIPILDGGHIFLLFVEFLNRKPLSLKKRELAQKIGLLILIPIFLYVFYNDITRILGW
jgi:regulator of sigma E protease